MTLPQVVCVLDWHGEPPYGLTAVAVAPDRLAEAEALAFTALGGFVHPASWEGADPELRTRVVRACRPIPTEGLWHVSHDRPGVTEERSRRACLRQLTEEWPHARPLAQHEAGPGLAALVRLTALVCRMPPEILLDAEEDLLDVYDTYTVGGPDVGPQDL
ncbi:hypothetical protein [Streptomyces subrutilus]|uniref:Uncharacterized protein n=1 Tax=Streptomyces subrutilus TaxID=36818 RepID=A0A1E5PLC1_9ACTN|nr:hypothetical protein [Streptomyces subrutilus]OEJ30142.1 hypothetical protein BGK67_01030 [Streptomyces subrutilus]